MLKTIDFLKELQEQMQYEDQHDNDIQASPRFWVIREGNQIVNNTMFLTKYDARAHLLNNKHNYSDKAHTYAMTAHRSPRVEQLIQILNDCDWDRVTELEAENETLHSTLENERKENITLTNENQRVKKRNRRLSKSVSELKRIVNNKQYRKKWLKELEGEE